MIRAILFRKKAESICLLFTACLLVVPFLVPQVASIAGIAAAISLSALPADPPTVKFTGLRHYARVEGSTLISVTASDDVGVSRVELYLESQLISAVDVSPNLPSVAVPFVWNSASATNGKHVLIAKARDSSGNWQAATIVLISRNYSGATPTPTPPTGNNITLNPATTYQWMTGWEATAQAGQLESPAWNNYKASLLDQAANDLGINRLRVEVASGAENPVDYYAQWRAGLITISQYSSKRFEIINDNADPNVTNTAGFKWSALDDVFDDMVIPLQQRLQARGETLWVSICYVDFGPSSFEHKSDPAEYGEFVKAAYQHVQARYGFSPDSWEVVLEPDTTEAGWSALQVSQALKAAGDKLAAAGFTPRFVAPSTTSAANALIYIDQIAQTAGAMQHVSEFSYHRYCCVTDTVLDSIANRAVQYNKNVGMLEWIGADYSTLHQDLKLGRNSSWQQYTLAFPNEPDNGAQYYLVTDTVPTLPTVALGSRTKILRQYFKYIRQGAKRIQALTGNSNFDPLAFINRDGKYVVVVKTSSGGAFNIHGLPAGTYGIKYSTELLYDINLLDVSINSGQALVATIPTSGVITIYRR